MWKAGALPVSSDSTVLAMVGVFGQIEALTVVWDGSTNHINNRMQHVANTMPKLLPTDTAR